MSTGTFLKSSKAKMTELSLSKSCRLSISCLKMFDFLLSNNYVNQVIGLRYDFSNDEILAYYIYLLRTLSFKLSKDTIYFFFNEHLDDFPLYSEAIKFFNHEESMIRIAVRVITLNVYSVNDRQMQDFILDRTTTTYFSNLVWFIGNYGTTVNDMLLHPGEGEFSRMNYYLAEHMDCFYYVNDIIELDVPKINKILISHLLNRLLRPMYLDSLHPSASSNTNGNKSSTSFGLLGTSPANFESIMPVLSAPTARSNAHPLAPAHSAGTSQQQNPFKTTIYEYLSQVDSDRLVLPALLLVYLAGHNPGVMSDVLLGTDIYPQRLLKSKMLMGNLMSSSSPPSRTQIGATSMSRERSSDSILSTNSTGGTSTVVWATPPPGQGISSTIAGSLFGAAGSATAARMRTRTESPLFETDEADEESRETEELLLASADSQVAEPPATPNRRRPGAGPLSTSLPSSSYMSSLMSRNNSADGDSQSKPKPRSGGRRSSKPSSLLGPALSSGTDETPMTRHLDAPAMVQELKPVFTSKEDREGATSIYPSTDEEDEGQSSQRTRSDAGNNDKDPIKPPPLPPRPTSEQQQDESSSIQESVSTQVAPTIQNREELMDRLVDIICGQPESGAHRFRILTIQVAAELLIEFVYTKGGAGKETAAAQAAQQAAAESQLGETRLYRLALAEAQTRDRVQKGIRALEKKKKSSGSGVTSPAGSQNQPLGMLTGRVERSLTESKLGMDKQVVNVIAESSVMYGPDKDLENELDLDPDPDLVRLFDLDPEFTSINRDKLAVCDDDRTLKGSIDLPPTSNSSSGSSIKEGRRARMKSKIKAKTQGPAQQGQSTMDSQHHQPPPSPQPHRPPPTALSRLEAMVVRYIKWLHILIQCRQLMCRNPTAASAALLESVHSTSAATAASGALAGGTGHPLAKTDSPTISITETVTMPALLDRRTSDFLGAGNISNGHLSGTSTPKAPATTATTTSITAMPLGAEAGVLDGKGTGGLLPGSSLTSPPSTQTNSAISSASSSTSSLSSFNPSSATGTASGRNVGSRTPLTATAALEAAAQHQQQQHQLAGGSSSLSSSHPFVNEMNEMLLTHLDPLSSSVSEVIRKSSAKLKKSVVDPLAANPLFRSVSSASPSLTVGSGGGERDSSKGSGRGGGSTAVSSAASSVRSVKSKSDTTLLVGMERTVSAASSVNTSTASTVAEGEARGGGGNGFVVEGRGSHEISEKEDTAAAPVVETVSILDPSHPAHQSDEQVIKILETLGLKPTSTAGGVVVDASVEPSSGAASINSSS
ncbi:Protein CL16A [Linnemannia zychae]|nr:Protein CL16A [Linnemannia zychae]